MRLSIATVMLAAGLCACTDADTSPLMTHADALDAQATAWCAHIRHPDIYCEASYRYIYGYLDDNAVSLSDHQACLADMTHSPREADGWRCPTSCDAIWLADGEAGPVWH